jgi:membrane fusion protein (multidrug efflux system)
MKGEGGQVDAPRAVESVDETGLAIEMRSDESGAPKPNRPSDGPADDAQQAEPASYRRHTRRLVVVALVVCLVVAGGVGYWYTHRNLQSTDDAFIDGNAITISPRVSGTIERLHFTDNQKVHKGDLLIEIDPRDYQAILDDARAMLAEAKARQAVAAADLDLSRATTAATLAQAESQLAAAQSSFREAQAQVEAKDAEANRAAADVPRYQSAASKGAASQEHLDQALAAARQAKAQLAAAEAAAAEANANIAEAKAQVERARTAPYQIAVKEAALKAATAQVAAAEAAVQQASLNLSYTRIYAPETGHITKRSVDRGDVVQKDQVLTSLVVGTPWVTANYKETELTRMRPGQPVDIEIDAYPDAHFKGHVDSIQRGTGARFSLLPPENATGNYVKVVQRVPVKIVFDHPPGPQYVLGLGMSVVPTVDVGARPTARVAKDENTGDAERAQ